MKLQLPDSLYQYHFNILKHFRHGTHFRDMFQKFKLCSLTAFIIKKQNGWFNMQRKLWDISLYKNHWYIGFCISIVKQNIYNAKKGKADTGEQLDIDFFKISVYFSINVSWPELVICSVLCELKLLWTVTYLLCEMWIKVTMDS